MDIWLSIGADKNLSSFSHETGRASKFPRHQGRSAAVAGGKKRGPVRGPGGGGCGMAGREPGRCVDVGEGEGNPLPDAAR